MFSKMKLVRGAALLGVAFTLAGTTTTGAADHRIRLNSTCRRVLVSPYAAARLDGAGAEGSRSVSASRVGSAAVDATGSTRDGDVPPVVRSFMVCQLSTPDRGA